MDRAGRSAARDAQHGGDEARARALRGRLRAGSLPAERLRLAAGLGDRAARLALDHHETVEDTLADRIEALTFGLSKEATVRVALAAARAALRRWEAERGEAGPELVLQTVEAWLSCPCAHHADHVREAARVVWSGPTLVMGQPIQDDSPAPVEQAARAAATAGRVVTSAAPYDRAESVTAALFAAEAAGERAVWGAIQAELLPWALGATPG